ncbi:GMP synthase (glutamine-hydrolyzing) [Leptospira biflexa serovar Patoc strain 'Patoc 1 (Ames)']|uniref:GMP synthase (glutamine-hydrolyzing) n=1 Tax=Leptospira biflexa serovar Patoc (strain Patoc 1 / ATCC 23582 / Paris) TaxID=456481 RepID=B0SR21_LEPBP|nr:glutamine-hydrolyzing GMP synthase [Leptospira biflexa]ABZ94074.1 GMP synthase (glutamine-hydrolyzing) [Leptospira biflexa serovar Patoc strain 'Patoc 1 (Ames)']ABZ97722.1 GMP synthetase [glutamine-hydrolyzing] (Glutamine amidotransferase; GMP synthetase) [Leptospira biflexa serovar Patoc strain 'Patoc 1 (Paris)']
MTSDKKIAVVDFGGQYAHLIASRIRRLGAYTEILSNEEPLSRYESYAGIILSGGPSSVYETGAPLLPAGFFDTSVPVLGICYGHQLMMKTLGGEVVSASTKEYGPAILEIENPNSPLSQSLSLKTKVWMSHGDEVVRLPNDFQVIAKSDHCRYAFVSHPSKNLFGIQFHPEVTHSEEGEILLKNFVELCGASGTWSIQHFLDEQIQSLQKKVPEGKNVFLLVSGGVDSSVAYLLLAKALGKDRVKGLLVDTGFMRKNEVKDLMDNLHHVGFDLTIWDESEVFYKSLQNEFEPEKKRRIVGDLFLEAQGKATTSLGLDAEHWLLGQGTIYPDTIESGGTKHSHKIKTHHNRVPQIEALIREGKIVEPIADLYKDEVRELGRTLGLPERWIERHPFPGPGLVVRMIASPRTSPPNIDFSIWKEKIPKAEIQILPILSVGVQGDQRSYAHCAVLSDFTSDWKELDNLSVEITNTKKEINRVVLAPGITHFEKDFFYTKLTLDKTHADILRDADAIVNQILYDESIHNQIWQMPVVLVPVGLRENSYGVVLRPVESTEAMTANFYQMNRNILARITKELLELPQISLVMYDLTHKPPGTIEWE